MKKLLIPIIILVLIQFIPNFSSKEVTDAYSIEKGYVIPDNVKETLKNACDDCHSDKTVSPWYTSIQPIGFWINHHVNEGKEHLNFSNFMKLPAKVQRHKLDEVIETVEEGEMPLSSYTYFGLHPKANLSEQQKGELIAWARDLKSKIKD